MAPLPPIVLVLLRIMFKKAVMRPATSRWEEPVPIFDIFCLFVFHGFLPWSCLSHSYFSSCFSLSWICQTYSNLTFDINWTLHKNVPLIPVWSIIKERWTYFSAMYRQASYLQWFPIMPEVPKSQRMKLWSNSEIAKETHEIQLIENQSNIRS